VLVVDCTHESSGGRENFINKDENGLLRCELDPLPDNVDELPNCEILDVHREISKP
jgi:hypothetical protein